MKNTNQILFIAFAVSLSFIAHTYDRNAFAEEVKSIKDFTRTLEGNPAHDALISSIKERLESNHTNNETIANMYRIIANEMSTGNEKAHTLSNIFDQERRNQQYCNLGFVTFYFYLPITAIILSAYLKFLNGK